MSFDICSHCRQLVGCQMPNFFSRIAGRSPRVSAASRKLLAIVSATVSTAGPAMLVFSLSRPPGMPALAGLFEAGLAFSLNSPLKPRSSPPGFLLFPAPLAAGALFLGAEIEFLDVL